MPTENTRAYDFYLSGNDYILRHDRENSVPLAAQQYERAVQEDPEFALGWTALSRAHSAMYFNVLDETDTRLELAREAFETAFQISPSLPEASRVEL